MAWYTFPMEKPVCIIGAGLAGSEAALQLAARGIDVRLHEMRPVKETAVHKTALCAELVCSNSLKSMKETTVYATATLPKGGKATYKILLKRGPNFVSWKVDDVDLYFASTDSAAASGGASSGAPAETSAPATSADVAAPTSPDVAASADEGAGDEAAADEGAADEGAADEGASDEEAVDEAEAA